MGTALESRPREGESWAEFQSRRRKEAIEVRKERTKRELFRLALVGLNLARYVFGVEHGMADEGGPWRVHAYVACKECYQNRAGIVDPRTLVANSAIREELDPENETLAVGANMLNVIASMMDHEQRFHGGRTR
jgi:hypothetical protein